MSRLKVSGGSSRSVLNSNVILYAFEDAAGGSAIERPLNSEGEQDCFLIAVAGFYILTQTIECGLTSRTEIRRGPAVDNSSGGAEAETQNIVWGAGYPSNDVWAGHCDVGDRIWLYSSQPTSADRYNNRCNIIGPFAFLPPI